MNMRLVEFFSHVLRESSREEAQKWAPDAFRKKLPSDIEKDKDGSFMLMDGGDIVWLPSVEGDEWQWYSRKKVWMKTGDSHVGYTEN